VKNRGVHVVNHSAGWFVSGRGDGTGVIGSIVADAKASGILWVNSAGNEAETHWSGTYAPDGDDVHDWVPGDEGNTFVWPNGSSVCGLLKWDEWPAAVSDFDLALVRSGTNVPIEISDGDQTGSQSPLEGLCVEQHTGVDLEVFWAILGHSVSTSPRVDLFSFSPPLEHRVAAGSVADPATSTAALAVGALCWQTRTLAPYSSQGPTIDGRIKPDLVGHDSVSSATYGGFTTCPSAFAGTSASSPEVAGAAALVKRAYPAYGPDQLRRYLVRDATRKSKPSPDNLTGAGELRLPKPPDVVAPSARAIPGAGWPGRTLKLLSRISDDSGEARVVAQVKRNARVVKTLRKRYVSARGETTVTVFWNAPAQAKGAYRHCVRAIDRSGNASPVSCAKVVLR
jgi:subtilisin family serine protease